MPDWDATNSAGLAWHPGHRKYYAAFAGNEKFAMAVFDENGKSATVNRLTTLQDIRGLWYNPKTKSLEANRAGYKGNIRYLLNRDGLPEGYSNIHVNTTQPGFQPAGTFDPKSGCVIFFDGKSIHSYRNKSGALKLTITPQLQAPGRDYNSTSIIVVPSRKGQAGVLNVSKRAVEFYHLKNGHFTGSVQLPDYAPVADMFGFAYANGYYWLFDVDNRTWKGYR